MDRHGRFRRRRAAGLRPGHGRPGPRAPSPSARLVALGVPAALLRRVDGVQNLIPLLTTIVLATGLGLISTSALAHTAAQPFALSPTVLGRLLALVAVGAVLMSCVTIPFTRSRIRASDLRDE